MLHLVLVLYPLLPGHIEVSTLTKTLEWPENEMSEDERRMCQYWGHLITPSGISPRFNALIVAICDTANAITNARPPAVPLPEAAVYIMPETFATVLLIFGIEDPSFGPPEIVEEYGPQHFDDIFAQYYIAFGLPFVWATRPDSNRRNELPLIKRQTVKTWVRNYLLSNPDEIIKRLNAILYDILELVHPMEDEPFLCKKIPRRCAPDEVDLATNSAIIKAFAEFQEAEKAIIAAAEPVQTLQRARQEYLNVVQQARIQKEYSLNVNGGWTKDEYGEDKYVQSCIF
jgi:hypothetical protein